MTALLSQDCNVAYHLFDCIQGEIIKKAKWKPQHQGKFTSNLYFIISMAEDSVTGLHFAPEGSRIAMIDYGGNCVVSELNSDESLFSIKMGGVNHREFK